MKQDDEIWDDLFHGCAWHAYLETLHSTGQSPPDPEKIRRRAYELYETELKNQAAS